MPLEFENGYVAFEDLPQQQRKIPGLGLVDGDDDDDEDDEDPEDEDKEEEEIIYDEKE